MSDEQNQSPRTSSQSQSSGRAIPLNPFRSQLGDANSSSKSSPVANPKWNQFIESVASRNGIPAQSKEEAQLMRLNLISSPERAATVLGAIFGLKKTLLSTLGTVKKTEKKVDELEVTNESVDSLTLTSPQTTLLLKLVQSWLYSGLAEGYLKIGIKELEVRLPSPTFALMNPSLTFSLASHQTLMRKRLWDPYWHNTKRRCASFNVKLNSDIKEKVKNGRTAQYSHQSHPQMGIYLELNPNPTQESLREFFGPDVLAASSHTIARSTIDTQPYHRLSWLVALQSSKPGEFSWKLVDDALALRITEARQTARKVAKLGPDDKLESIDVYQQILLMDKAVFNALPADEEELLARRVPSPTHSPRSRTSSPRADSPDRNTHSATKRPRADDDDNDEFSQAFGNDSPNVTPHTGRKKQRGGKGKEVTEESRRGEVEEDSTQEAPESDDMQLTV
ncbi:hypothetical protein P7C70_g5344, partial [Phenoliferia sp. Uapishka_3]